MLDAAQSAWVFGGMGSWNDLGFAGAEQKEYERVSKHLYAALTDAICAWSRGSSFVSATSAPLRWRSLP
jgi:hypothetical protein